MSTNGRIVAALAALACAAIPALGACEQILDIQPVPVPDGGDAGDGQVSDVASEAAPDGGATCGTLGFACCDAGVCTDGTQCVDGTKGPRCVAFAGAFENVAPTGCAPNSCVDPNPVTGACTCPSPAASSSSYIDVSCGDPSAPTHLDGTFDLCAIATRPAGSDWAGAFLSADIASCEPGADAGCMMPNPLTGACTCPDVDAGVEALQLRVFVPGAVQDGGCQNPDLGGNFTVCLPQVKPTSLFGVYEKDAFGACRKFSKSLQGCNCPSNTLRSELRSVEETPDGCSSSCLYPQTTITFCVAI